MTATMAPAAAPTKTLCDHICRVMGADHDAACRVSAATARKTRPTRLSMK